MAATSLVIDNPVFRMFIGYAAVVLLKTMLMSVFTAYYRITKKVFINQEDADSFSGRKRKLTIVVDDPDVERVRRCHQNDLENVIPFVLLGLLYVATGPSVWAASLHFRIFTVSRLLHTVVYLFVVPQPSRLLCFFVGVLVNTSMVVNIISTAAF